MRYVYSTDSWLILELTVGIETAKLWSAPLLRTRCGRLQLLLGNGVG